MFALQGIRSGIALVGWAEFVKNLRVDAFGIGRGAAQVLYDADVPRLPLLMEVCHRDYLGRSPVGCCRVNPTDARAFVAEAAVDFDFGEGCGRVWGPLGEASCIFPDGESPLEG